MTQDIRLSQFILTYGPGAILESTSGPRIIPLPDTGLFYSGDFSPENFEIYDPRISKGLLNGARIFKLPSNAELGRPQNYYVYRTKPFPSWKLCLNTRMHGGNFNVIYHGKSCPICNISGRKGTESIRFIMACPDGHMDDINWNYLVHGNNSNCDQQWFKWYGGGGSLSNVEIECPICRSRANLGEAYRHTWRCSGRYPEKENINDFPNRPGCDKNARIIQRQASNLRIAELVTLFSIPPRHTNLHNLLHISYIEGVLVANRPSSLTEFKKTIQRLVEGELISPNVEREIFQCEWDEIKQAIQDVLSPIPKSYNELILDEFHALVDGSTNGVPPLRGPRPNSPVTFEIKPSMVRMCIAPNGTKFRITPVTRLSTVTVNTGYRREVETSSLSEGDTHFLSKHVSIVMSDPQNPSQLWYPGVQFLGEGIFITIEEKEGFEEQLSGESSDNWMKSYLKSSSYPPYVFRDSEPHEELHPLFIYWHTLSHLLIRAISVEAGYSSASIRERIYLDIENKRGGVLLYASQPGTDGTLGGLIALVPYFQDLFDIAFEQLQTCSGDPLCKENHFTPGKHNGAACYGCLLVSETSCEHRNMWLDRNVLLENMP